MNTRMIIGLLATLAITVEFCNSQDIAAWLEDRRFVNKQIDCILNRAPCDFVGRHIKHLLPEVLNNNCGACTVQQARNARIMVEFMQQNYPQEWRSIVQRYRNLENEL